MSARREYGIATVYFARTQILKITALPATSVQHTSVIRNGERENVSYEVFAELRNFILLEKSIFIFILTLRKRC